MLDSALVRKHFSHVVDVDLLDKGYVLLLGLERADGENFIDDVPDREPGEV